jgi:hypothetical protein
VIENNDKHPEKQLSSRNVIDSGIVTENNDKHPEKQ